MHVLSATRVPMSEERDLLISKGILTERQPQCIDSRNEVSSYDQLPEDLARPISTSALVILKCILLL